MPLLNVPRLARSDDRTRFVLEPERIAEMVDVATRRAPVSGMVAASFDFFVDWERRQLEGYAWVKRALPAGCKLPTSRRELEAAVAGDPAIRRCCRLAHGQGNGVTVAIFDDARDWSRSTGRDILMVNLPPDGPMRMTPVTLAQLQAAIQLKSGGPMRIGSKGLVLSTTALEAHLSKTSAPWPGDADLVVFGAHDREPRCVIELKKHTEKSRLPFDAQRVENYAGPGGPDQRKYDRLSLLAEQVSVGAPLPLYTLYYSTERTQEDLRLERVTRDGAGGFRGRPVATIGQSYRLPTQVLEAVYAAARQDAVAHPPLAGVRSATLIAPRTPRASVTKRPASHDHER
ncbi:MAG: hypothetical protein ABTQ27_15585 [Amaricoccus sp.]|mgnify:CR=1 FL=1|uniref:hypothetical protein n=1 Tax=Amaricoccus sp. TaxID=1872485 RepID=UPI0033145BDD